MNDGITMRVQFSQTFTIHPPESVQDKYDAEFFLQNEASGIIRDVVDERQGELEILEIND